MLNFAPIEGFEGLYEINFRGVVRKLDQPAGPSAAKKGRKTVLPGRIMKQRLRAGYFAVRLTKNKKGKDFSVHRLIAITFIPNPEKKPEVNHKNGIKTDNSIDNLEWATDKENSNHALDTGLARHGERCRFSKLKEVDVIEIFRLHNDGVAGTQIANRFNVYKNTIYHIVNGKNWRRFQVQKKLIKKR